MFTHASVPKKSRQRYKTSHKEDATRGSSHPYVMVFKN